MNLLRAEVGYVDKPWDMISRYKANRTMWVSATVTRFPLG